MIILLNIKEREMGRKNTRKRIKKKNSFSFNKIIPIKWFFCFLIIIFLFVFIFIYGKKFLLNDDLFKIKHININKYDDSIIKEIEDRINSKFLNKNIFVIDLKKIEDFIKNSFYYLKKVEIRKKFPDILEIDIISRNPFAVLDTHGGIVIDKEGFVVSIGTKNTSLIKIKGINFFLKIPSKGEKIEIKELKDSLILLSGIKNNMNKYKKDIKFIDVSNKNNILLGIYDFIVKMGVDDFSKKIKELRIILNDPNIDVNDIKYIDLRFEDPIIAPKQI